MLARARFVVPALTLLLACGDDETESTSVTDSGGETTGDSDATASDATGPSTTAGTTGGAPGDAMGCDGATLLENPVDTAARGPWPVGARTVTIEGRTVEVWYPAAPGSDAGVEPIVYDVRDALPDSEQAKVTDALNPWQTCDCYRDLPVDANNGPYPGIVFVHGTAGFRTQSLEFMVHWASRGFIVMSADHPGLWLKDLLGLLCMQGMVPQDLTGDINAVVAAFQTQTGGLEFLSGVADGGRVAMSGHSAGGGAIEGFGGVAQVLIPMAAGGVSSGAALRSTLVLAAQSDQVVGYSDTKAGFESSPAPRRFVGIADTGHLAFSSLCSLKNGMGQDFLQIADAAGVCGAQFASALFDCDPEYTADEISWSISQYASSAALESVLHCSGADASFAALQSTYPEVGEFIEAL